MELCLHMKKRWEVRLMSKVELCIECRAEMAVFRLRVMGVVPGRCLSKIFRNLSTGDSLCSVPPFRSLFSSTIGRRRP